MSCVGGAGEGGEDLGDVEGHFFFFFRPWVVVFEGPFLGGGREGFLSGFRRVMLRPLFSLLLLLLLLLGLAGCLSLACFLACYYNTIATAIDAVQKGYVVSSLATSVKVAAKFQSS